MRHYIFTIILNTCSVSSTITPLSHSLSQSQHHAHQFNNCATMPVIATSLSRHYSTTILTSPSHCSQLTISSVHVSLSHHNTRHHHSTTTPYFSPSHHQPTNIPIPHHCHFKTATAPSSLSSSLPPTSFSPIFFSFSFFFFFIIIPITSRSRHHTFHHRVTIKITITLTAPSPSFPPLIRKSPE